MDSKVKVAQRESGIELCKIMAMFMIVINHVTQTLSEKQEGLEFAQLYLIDLKRAYSNYLNLPLCLFRYLGSIGNLIFFIASAWFLCKNYSLNLKKALKLVIETWLISIALLLIFVLTGVNLTLKDIIFSLFPTMFSNNWYITCYIIILFLHSYINKGLDCLTRREFKILCFVLSCAYLVLSLIKDDLLFSNILIIFLVIYIDISYLRKYHMDILNSGRTNLLFVLWGGGIILAALFCINFLGLKYEIIGEQMFHLSKISNPFLILLSLGLFNLFRKRIFFNRFINFISSLSLYVYLLHENILVRKFLRPSIWIAIYNFQEKNFSPILDTLIYSLIMFMVSLAISATIKNIVNIISTKVSNRLLLKWVGGETN